MLTHRIAMWSGPRNISTALMRAWGNRSDCFVTDEPLYAHYLRQTGLDHPGRAETLSAHDADWKSVTQWLTGPIPEGKTVWYQKQMAHHLLPEIDRSWLSHCENCFLVRDPQEMITSLIKFIPEPALQDTGLPQQIEIFDRVRESTGEVPPVIDGRDVQNHPREIFEKLCNRLNLAFSEDMLQWPPGLRETDGAWAPFWYENVRQTTRFEPYRAKQVAVPARLQGLLSECQDIYRQLADHRITVS